MNSVHIQCDLRALVAPSGAGKTFLAPTLARAWGDTTVVPGDIFLKPPQERKADSWFMNKWRKDQADVCLGELVAGRPFKVKDGYNQVTRRWDLTVELIPAPIVLVESVIALYLHTTQDFALWRVWLEVPREVRIARQIKRLEANGLSHGPEYELEIEKIYRKVYTEDPIVEGQKAMATEVWGMEEIALWSNYDMNDR